MATIGPLLQQPQFDEARPLLETLLQLQPDQPEVLYNLGVLASEDGRLEEARQLLRRAVVANACDAHAQANAQVVLGLAALRQRTEQKQDRPWRPRSSWNPATALPCAASAACW